MIKDPSMKGNLKKNLKQFSESIEHNKENFLREYKSLERTFKNIKNCLEKFQINDIVDYFENSNEEITEEGDMNLDDFKKLMINIDISDNLNFQQ